MTALFVIIGAAVGAPLRYVTDRAVQSAHGTSFPWGTVTVNLVASLVLGVVIGASAGSGVSALVGTGFCGGLSTWSTLGYETIRLAEAGERTHAVLDVVIQTFAGLGAAALGLVIGAAL
ncbi:CrcB family protein [Actinomycetospora endophytica]|uniref:Fluoride-specific ion channel FluC n=1 Tax=Actinomycetospora endophytica TaxID=2291215 RepID=A0ABS8P3B3_9PSEU|nr:CrcB family protein [Actinomycetospora endophytica]MCD2192723.1 CrcB family protein [Actinomycetospora endophytica]